MVLREVYRRELQIRRSQLVVALVAAMERGSATFCLVGGREDTHAQCASFVSSFSSHHSVQPAT